MSEQAWQHARNILCIRLDYLGDVLMTTPALRALKESLPGRRLTLLTSRSGAEAARFIPEVDAAIEYDAPWLKSSNQRDARADMAMIRLLRRHRFDAAVIFTVYSQNPLPSALLCHLARIPLRLAHCHENPYQLLTHWVRDPEPQERVRHEVQRQLDLVATIGARTADERLSFRVAAADAEWAASCLRSLDIAPGMPWVVLHPGATAASRRYPAQHWKAVARDLSARLACPLVLTGSAQEAALAQEIGAGIARAYSLAGQLSLGQLGALIAAAPLVISNNTGPAHIAAAVGTPVVDLYALTNPQHTPWQVPSRVLFEDVPCRFCYKSVCPQGHHRCLEGVSPARVVGAALELL
ncbi:lipopolysaccharide heptosyltransferase II [Noviherbaspirillum autotrophicum]|uniref:lipopolysaccharide heptosyltransferase II n=1 Tax=Noviherbaspirillum autotrophicum TaxID=709839 RepID=A0A0C2BTJ7_9BURK|nr:lipopolysaccharide heptosyltransferase II [Noviherbaspirillum autotrophicum]KIF81351.1 glycosyl transferase [Noviherbaspirillum autotrophicum]